MKRKGFTLIELLAVIIILGLLMLIAIPSVTSYINSTRKSSYVTIAKTYANEVINKITARKYVIKKDGVAYFIPVDIIDIDTGTKASPYSNWEQFNTKIRFVAHNDESVGNCSKRPSKVLDSGNLVVYDSTTNSIVGNSIYNKLSNGCYKEKTYSEAFVIVIYNNEKAKYEYYWTSRDDSGHVIFPKKVDAIKDSDVVTSNSHVVTFDTQYVYGIDRNSVSTPSLSEDNKFEVSVLNSIPTDMYDTVSLYIPGIEFISQTATLVAD